MRRAHSHPLTPVLELHCQCLQVTAVVQGAAATGAPIRALSHLEVLLLLKQQLLLLLLLLLLLQDLLLLELEGPLLGLRLRVQEG